MDYAACNVVYVDRNAREDRLVKREDATSTASPDGVINYAEHHTPVHAPTAVDENLQTLLGIFSEVYVCISGKSCISKLSELNQSSIVELIPTLVLIDIPYEDQLAERPSREVRTPSPSTQLQIDGVHDDLIEEEAYGLSLLEWIACEIQYQSLSRLVVPVAVVSIPEQNPLLVTSRGRTNSRSEGQLGYTSFLSKKRGGLVTPLDQTRTVKYLDVGAVDVLTSPLLKERLPSLAIHAYRAHKDASKEHRALMEMKRGRKRSWVGVDDQKPYAYLREAMVSGLMDGICKLGGDEEPMAPIRISIALNRREKIAASVGSWHFSAHEFTDDELLHAALLMLQHALTMPELERWRISTEHLTAFLVASRSAYNAFVPYHNFRHVVDVLQACFHFLVRLGRLPPYPISGHSPEPPLSPIAALIRPFDALTLLITAIGHDVGHPGVNNAFLVTLNAPLAQLYNDRSVLESFHCAAYSQILRRYWPAAFRGQEMRQLMISSILATDMGLHFDYMKKLGFLQEKLHENGGTDGWNGRLIDEQRTLACSLLIKCADISNVARKYEVAARWTSILTDEFSRQASMETDLGIPTALFAAPTRAPIELGKSQIGFMNMFAIPLFQGVTDVMPGMAYCVEELLRNKAAWEQTIADEQERVRKGSDDSTMKDGMFSPRTMSVANPSDASYQKVGNVLSPDMDLRKALLSKNPFPTNGVAEEGRRHHTTLPEISPGSEPLVEDSATPSPSEVLPDSSSRRSSKPSQLQLSFATASAPGLLDHPSQDSSLTQTIDSQPNGISVNHQSLVTDPVVIDPPTPQEPKAPESEKQRSSDGTEGSNSAGDWTSQATSATTGKMPLSPSTQGTSIMSDADSIEKGNSSQILTPTGTSTGNGRSCGDRSSSKDSTTQGSKSEGDGEENKGPPSTVTEKIGKLKKKPSRFRMNFWKRSKSASPPMPVGGARVGSEDGMSQ
ncbi:3',5'-cyclic-nucleotide phosphodiesterase [Cadophora gregata]|uniref:3',5'-cyclic-nucleotide phosphodiesterase n=1 Tax=Cadophora gregata TaxID=51156 RepID=UPI0026DBA4E4|nr:3',5'-cyclic-nucleotide phosphodiesterase [Cadophora gregata]KAK0126831.1 3',5'-cyclic-nucleotide phosphodiesterase [Cadophora gregata]